MNVTLLKGREAPKAKRSYMDTKIFTKADMEAWRLPPFQRNKRINAKVLAVADEMKANGGVVPDVLTLGRIGNDKTVWLVDGQHRREAFFISEMMECIADVRMIEYEDMGEMANHYFELNSKLVTMRPDDVLRAMEETNEHLRRIRTACEFVTYSVINRYNTLTHVIGMSMLLRCWNISNAEVPSRTSVSAAELAKQLDSTEVDKLILFMQVARSAWKDDQENIRLWGTLNMVITMWLWRRLVTNGKAERGLRKAVTLHPDQFRKCLLSVSASNDYLDWLVNRQLGERDRVPCYNRLKAIFAQRLAQEGLGKVMLPQPGWVSR